MNLCEALVNNVAVLGGCFHGYSGSFKACGYLVLDTELNWISVIDLWRRSDDGGEAELWLAGGVSVATVKRV